MKGCIWHHVEFGIDEWKERRRGEERIPPHEDGMMDLDPFSCPPVRSVLERYTLGVRAVVLM